MHAGMKSRRELYNCLGIGGNCGKCVPQVKELIENHHESLMHNSANPSILAA
jgi:bacterioferritin-associated ferredoxin